MNIGSEKQRDHDEKVVEIEMKDVFDVCLTCPKSCRIYIARAGILIQISIVTTDTISKSEIVNAQAMYSNTIGNEI